MVFIPATVEENDPLLHDYGRIDVSGEGHILDRQSDHDLQFGLAIPTAEREGVKVKIKPLKVDLGAIKLTPLLVKNERYSCSLRILTSLVPARIECIRHEIHNSKQNFLCKSKSTKYPLS